MNQYQFDSSSGHVVSVSRCDRWQVCQRLQELEIPCFCSDDGQLWVEINTVTTALQVMGVMRRVTSSRLELIDWLERCWEADDDR